MNKLGIWGIVIAGAFFVGVLSANPVVEAVGGWKAAIAGHETRITDLESQTVPPTYWEIVDIFGNEGIVLCDLGDKIISGGVKIRAGSSSLQGNEPIFNVGPNEDQEGWFGQIKSPGSQLRISANCLDNPPLRP